MPKTNCTACGISITYSKRDAPPKLCPVCNMENEMKRILRRGPAIDPMANFKNDRFKIVAVKNKEEGEKTNPPIDKTLDTDSSVIETLDGETEKQPTWANKRKKNKHGFEYHQ